jgi:hypothetical protein
MMVDLDTVCGCGQTYGFDRFEDERDERLSHHDKINFHTTQVSDLTKRACSMQGHSLADQKATTFFLTKFAEVRESGGSVHTEITFEWGGSGGASWGGSVTAEGHDDHGNSGQLSYEYNSDSGSSITASSDHGTNASDNKSEK